MRARAALPIGVALAVAVATVACGGDDDGDGSRARPAPREVAAVDDALRVRTEERTFAGLRTLVVRPNGDGSWPLVLFVHGAGAPPEFYVPFLEDLAAGGYVVVAPAMPGSVDRADLTALQALPFQPGRLRQVLAAVTAGPGAIGVVDADRVAVAGHSMGGMTALAVGFNTCCTDSRVDAAVAIAGQLAPFPGGGYQTGTVPLLLVHGEEDDVVPYDGSVEALRAVGTTAYLLTVEGGDHGQYLNPADDAYPAVRDATLAFLTATVGDDAGAGLADLETAGTAPGVRLETRT